MASRTGYTHKGEIFDLMFAAPATGRYLMVASYGGASWTALGDGTGRTDWVDSAAQPGTGGGTTNNVPEPGSLPLVALALASLVLRRAVGAAPPGR